MAEVKIQEGESIESALRRFKRKVQQEDIIKDIKKHSFYLKPGDKRLQALKEAIDRQRKALLQAKKSVQAAEDELNKEDKDSTEEEDDKEKLAGDNSDGETPPKPS